MNATAAHPTVAALRARPPVTPKLLAPLDSATLRRLCLECGADGAGFVELDRPALSLANTEFHHATDQVNAVGHALVRALEGRGLRALNVTAGFPGGSGCCRTKPPRKRLGSGAWGFFEPDTPQKDETAEARMNDIAMKAAYCLAVCPAGEDVAGPFLASKSEFVRQIVRPLQEKAETIYVVPGSDAEAHVHKRFPAKKAKPVRGTFRARTVAQFLAGLPLGFQPNQSAGLDAAFHFTFTGAEKAEATVIIRDRRVQVQAGLQGRSDLHITTDTQTWFRFLARERNVVVALLLGRIRLRGPLRLFQAFGRCFPS